jgi:hypothetical protein
MQPEEAIMTLYTWPSAATVRHFSLDPAQPAGRLLLEGARNERLSFQVALRLAGEAGQRVSLEASAPGDWAVRVRRVGYVPVRHANTPVAPQASDFEGPGRVPGYVPDPLFDESTLFLPAGETHAFWISLQPGEEVAPGDYAIRVRVVPERGAACTHEVTVRLYDVTLEPRRDFRVTHWFYVDALIDWYRTDLFDDRFWTLLARYVRDVVEHGQDTLYVPAFTPPLDGVKRPSQLLGVERSPEGSTGYPYRLDWRDVRRYVATARAAGITHFEWCHPFTQWGARYGVRVYEGQGREEKLLWPPTTEATSDTYRAFLAQYLAELRRFLEVEGILDRSLFHVSDEPHGEEDLANYRRARGMLRELAPWMQVMDALTDITFARQGLTDMPIPSIQTALDFVREGIPCWCYYCCGPRGTYLNRLLDTPLDKIAMHGMLFYRWPFQGFLHWGYNYWYQSQTRQLLDPYTEQDGRAWERGWAYGDPFMVYPGPEGPVDSLRWEVFAAALQDYRLLQTLHIPRESALLGDLHSFEDFPKDGAWRSGARTALLSGHVR